MKPQSAIRVSVQRNLFLAFCLTLIDCHSQRAHTRPSIEFTQIPPAAEGGREKVDTIAGRVAGARPGLRVVVYARSGPWWVQPWPDRPFVSIHADSTWSTETHLGFEYAALLVDQSYNPPLTTNVLPTAGGSVLLVKTVKGLGTPQYAPTKPLHFSGYDWKVRTIAADRGGMNNLYSADNAWVDGQGALHLRIIKKQNRWSCAEVALDRSLGYGTYIVTVRDTSRLEPAAILSMITWDVWATDEYYREMDVEVGRWGDALRKSNAQYAIQPFYIPGYVYQFRIPPGTLTFSMRWESGRVRFESWRGASINPGATFISTHTFTSGIPTPGQETLRLVLYVVPSDKHPMQNGSEVVVEKFKYLP